MPTIAGAAQAADRTYANARFGYTIDYPAELIAQPESDNSDGRAFRSPDGKVEALLLGRYNAEGASMTALAKEAEADRTEKPAYARIARDFFAISRRAGANILYEKLLMAGDLECVFRITYPAADHAHWGRGDLARMSASLRQGR